ncbi:hypothetical protein [Leptolyngbya phage Lbo-JY46]
MEDRRKDFMKYYFALRDTLHSSGATGLSAVALHLKIKSDILPLMVDEPDVFDLDYDLIPQSIGTTFTTRWFTEKGWQMFIDTFKIWAYENYNIAL